jgi:hypothetical protein
MFVIVCPIGTKLWILFEIFIDQDTIGLKGLVVSEKNIIILPVWFPLYWHVLLFILGL